MPNQAYTAEDLERALPIATVYRDAVGCDDDPNGCEYCADFQRLVAAAIANESRRAEADALAKAAQLTRHVLIHDGCEKTFAGDWVAIPKEDFALRHQALWCPIVVDCE